MILRFINIILLAVLPVISAFAATPLTLDEFISSATKNDKTFEIILLDQLPLQYRRDVLLPDGDIMLDLKYQHYFYLDQNRDEPAASIALSKLFPLSGTELSLTYSKTTSALTSSETSSVEFLISQPIAKNAFGKGTQLQDKIIGIENDIIRYQIIEAYEDYLASLTAVYYNWYSAYENLKVGNASLASNQKLMANILDRQRQKIALPIDVNKMKLLLVGKKENIIILQEIYDNYTNLVYKAIAHNQPIILTPEQPRQKITSVNFDSDYKQFVANSRTYHTLRLLENQGTLEVKKAADDLLPSTNLLLGYRVDGQDSSLRNSQDSVFAGIQLSWPVARTVDKAREKLAQIKHSKTLLSNVNKYAELQTNLKNLYQQIQREQKLIGVAKEKVKLARAILKDEAENYSFGKVTLNDYIDAVNTVDENQFNLTDHIVQLSKLQVEWLRLTDQLVNNKILHDQIPQVDYSKIQHQINQNGRVIPGLLPEVSDPLLTP